MDEGEPCHAGVRAFFGGRWRGVAPHMTSDLTHVIRIRDSDQDDIKLCDEHFQQVLTAGLVSEPYVGGELSDEG